MSDRSTRLNSQKAKWNPTVRSLRRMALGITGVIILVWFVLRMERVNSYRGIETSRATGLSAYSYSAGLYNAPMLMKGAPPRVRLAQTSVLEEGRQIARTASLRVSVTDFSGARESVDRIVNVHSGFVTSLKISYPKDSARSLSAQIAIPFTRRDTAIEEFRKLGRVEEENQGAEEVTAQTDDLVIRLKNAKEAEERLAKIQQMGTGKVSDVLEVEREQTRVRGEIESMQAEQKELRTRIAFASIDLNLSEEYQAQLGGETFGAARQVRNALVDGYHSAAAGLLSVCVFLLSVGPSLLLWGLILFWPARWAWKRWRSARAEATASA